MQVTAFQTDNTVRQGVTLFFRDILLDNLIKVGEGHHGTAHHKVILPFLLLATQMLWMTVLESDSMAYLLCHPYFLTRTVNQFEVAVGEKDSEGNTRETASCAEVENLRAGLERMTLAIAIECST